MTRDEALEWGAATLLDAGILSARGDARKLVQHAATGSASPEMNVEDIQRFRGYIAARALHQPVSQIIGLRAFWANEFLVTQATLDPRPETELLVELASARRPNRVLDLGTGTGAVLISILSECADCHGIGTDVSQDALDVARQNADRIGVTSRASFVASDWWTSVDGLYDVVVSNPPYIPAADIADLDPDVRDWEPHLALSPGPEGLESYRAIAASLAEHLHPNGRGFFEFGIGQASDVQQIFVEHGLEVQAIHKDLSQKDRVIEVSLPKGT